MKLKLTVILLAFMLAVDFTGSTGASAKNVPFQCGEKLTFQIKWVFIPAGLVVFEVLPMETINGLRSYHFAMTAKTYPFIDIFYKLHERIDAYVDEEMNHSVLFKKKREGNSTRDVVVSFDWENRKAQYSNFGEKRDPIPILPGSFDPLSIFYVFRSHDLKENTVIQKPVTDGKKCVMGKATVIRREKIRVADKTYDTYLVEPELKHIGGVFQKTKHAKLRIWVTADNRRFPVRVKSELSVGSFVAELISIENGIPEIKSLKTDSGSGTSLQ